MSGYRMSALSDSGLSLWAGLVEKAIDQADDVVGRPADICEVSETLGRLSGAAKTLLQVIQAEQRWREQNRRDKAAASRRPW
jgi:hypothetical protein